MPINTRSGNLSDSDANSALIFNDCNTHWEMEAQENSKDSQLFNSGLLDGELNKMDTSLEVPSDTSPGVPSPAERAGSGTQLKTCPPLPPLLVRPSINIPTPSPLNTFTDITQPISTDLLAQMIQKLLIKSEESRLEAQNNKLELENTLKQSESKLIKRSEELIKNGEKDKAELNQSLKERFENNDKAIASISSHVKDLSLSLKNFAEIQPIVLENREKIAVLENEIAITNGSIGKVIEEVRILKQNFTSLHSQPISTNMEYVEEGLNIPNEGVDISVGNHLAPVNSYAAPMQGFRNFPSTFGLGKFDGDNCTAPSFIARTEEWFRCNSIYDDSNRTLYFLNLMTDRAAEWAEGVNPKGLKWSDLREIFLEKWNDTYVFQKRLSDWHGSSLRGVTDLESHLVHGLRLTQRAFPKRSFEEWAHEAIQHLPYKVRDSLLQYRSFPNERLLMEALRVAIRAANISDTDFRWRQQYFNTSTDFTLEKTKTAASTPVTKPDYSPRNNDNYNRGRGDNRNRSDNKSRGFVSRAIPYPVKNNGLNAVIDPSQVTTASIPTPTTIPSITPEIIDYTKLTTIVGEDKKIYHAFPSTSTANDNLNY